MSRKNALPLDMLEATRLTQAGRLVEATAAIQRLLRREAVREPVNDPAPGRIIDAEFSRVEESRTGAKQRAKQHEGQPGQFVSASFGNQAGTRPYKLYIPTRYAGQPLPMIVMLHGCTQTPDDFAAGTRMNMLAEERGCFVLYPAQTCAANRSRCWNWFKRTDQRRDKGEPAILAGMTRECMRRYAIDPRRVYVAGLSAGGAMAAVLAAAYPELYAAVGVHSGLAAGSAHDVQSAFAAMQGTAAARSAAGRRVAGSVPVPVIVFHGDCDATVHPRNGEQVVLESTDPAAASSVEQGQVPGGHAYTRTVHRDSTGRVVLEHWLVHGAGHAWSGGSPSGSYTDPKGPDAARAMLRFFEQSRRTDAMP
jgi:poly(hydroxyalkanoate) depolymerase family esterase